jgi:hypothetical protein
MANGWGGPRPGAGRKRDPLTPIRRRQDLRLNAARRLLRAAIEATQLGLEPAVAVATAVRAARRLVHHAEQLDLALDLAQGKPIPGGDAAAVRAAEALLEEVDD